jgi:carboxyl-terminal processing protease
MSSRYAFRIVNLLLFLMVAAACDRNDPPHPNQAINDWIYGNMKYWYYWTNEIPADPDMSLEHEAFFESLLSDKDRFSWIQENYQDLINSFQGVQKEAGFEYVLYRETEGGANVIGQILYVKQNSPASAAGLKRGDTFHQINGAQITIDNYSTLLAALGSNHTISYKPLNFEAKTFGDSQTISISPVVYAENPHHLNKVFTYEDRRIGYYVYTFFANGTSASPQSYSNEMDQIFSSFQGQAITDLVLDLRFNSGGSISAAHQLASLIGHNVNSTKLFIKYQYNEEVNAAILADPNLGESYLNVKFQDKPQNIGTLLQNTRVYILTGSRTASASELIINGLKPFMDVFLIGDVTVGKNLGSISIYDEDDPSNTWGMQPIVTKLLNSEDQADYDNGFTPQILDEDRSLYLYPLGDPREYLLNRALEHITGAPVLGRRREPGPPLGTPLRHSLDMKRRSGQAVIELPR